MRSCAPKLQQSALAAVVRRQAWICAPLSAPEPPCTVAVRPSLYRGLRRRTNSDCPGSGGGGGGALSLGSGVTTMSYTAEARGWSC